MFWSSKRISISRLIIPMALIAAAPSFGKSIFDDDVPDPKAANPSPTYHPPTPPTEAASPTQPAPAPETTAATPDSDPVKASARIPAMVTTGRPPAVAVIRPATPAPESPQAAKDRVAAEVDRALAASVEYQQAKAALTSAQTQCKDLDLSDTEKEEAWKAYNAAAAREKKAREAVIEKCPAAKQARLLAAQPASSSPQTSGSGSPVGRSPEIIDAIQHRDFIAGMTFSEACAAARKSAQLVSDDRHNRKTYRWSVQSQIGTHLVAIPGYQMRYATQPLYGIIAYVEATFDNDSLTEFHRYDAKR